MEGSLVTPESFATYAREGETWREDKLADAVSGRRWWRYGALACLATTVLTSTAAGWLYLKGPTGWILQCDSATGFCNVLQRVEQIEQPQIVKNRVLKDYVRMRESWSEADADSAFGAVACLSAPDEQERFQLWNNDSQSAPQQILGSRSGYRVATPTSDPIPIGVGKSGDVRVQVRYQFYDVVPTIAQHPDPTPAIATFTIKMGKKLPCNLGTGMFVTDYRRDLEKVPQ